MEKLKRNDLHIKYIEQLLGKTIETNAYIDYIEAKKEWAKKQEEYMKSPEYINGPGYITFEEGRIQTETRIAFLEERKIFPAVFKIISVSSVDSALNLFSYDTDKGDICFSFDVIQQLISTGEAKQYEVYYYKIIE